MVDMERLVDPIRYEEQGIENTGTYILRFWIEIKEGDLCWSSKENPACSLADCEHVICIPPSESFPAAKRPHIHLRLPEICVSHSINLCIHHTIKIAEHHVILLPAGTKVGDILNMKCGPYPWRLKVAKRIEEEKIGVR